MKSKEISNLPRFDWFFRHFLKHWKWFLAAVFAVILPGVIVSSFVSPVYRTHSSIEIWSDDLIEGFRSESAGSKTLAVTIDPSTYLPTEVELLMGRENLRSVADQLRLKERWGLPSLQRVTDTLRRMVRCEVRSGTRIVDVRVTSTNAPMAVEIANEIALKYVDRKKQLRLQRIDSLFTEIERAGAEGSVPKQVLDQWKIQAETNRANHMASIAVTGLLEGAEIPAHAYFPDYRYLLPCLTLLGILAGFGVLVYLAFQNHSHAYALQRLEKKLQTGPATLIPRSTGLLLHQERPFGKNAEPFRELRIRLDRQSEGLTRSKMVCVASPERGQGSAGVCLNLAIVLADAGRTVLLIDADMQRPTLHSVLHAASHPGISDFLTGEMRMEETVIRSTYPNLWFMPSGPHRDDPSSLYTSQRMDDLTRDMKSRFDYILVHSPAMSSSSDATALAGYADSSLLVAPVGRYGSDFLLRQKRLLETSGGVFTGLVLTGVDARGGVSSAGGHHAQPSDGRKESSFFRLQK